MSRAQTDPRTANASSNAAPAGADAGSALKAFLAPYRADVEKELLARLPPTPAGGFAKSLANHLANPRPTRSDPYVVYDPIQHVVAAGGKRLRPILTLLACEAVCGDAHRALPTAAGLELLHTFTLVHDDVMDNDLTRRGHPTVHALWGGPIAITAGDGLYALAIEAIIDNAQHPEVDAQTVLAVTGRAARVSFEICAGQTEDILFEQSDNIDRDAYMEMIRLKTGVLISVSVEAGARLAGATPEDLERFIRYGDELGLAFQIKDDVLDLIGQEAELGKPVGSDIRAGKKTYPVLHALDVLKGADRDRLIAILRAPEEDTTATMVAEALRIIDRCGALERAAEEAAVHSHAAKDALAGLSTRAHSEARKALEAIADYVVDRRI